MTPREARKAIRGLYRDIHGFEDLPREDRTRFRNNHSASTYGELQPAATEHLLDHLALGRRDVFYDLGSGLGRVVIQAAMSVRVKKIVGIELSRYRHEIGSDRLARARSEGWLNTRSVALRHASFLDDPLSDATVVYTCSTAFSEGLMRRLLKHLSKHLRVDTRVVSLQDFVDNRYLELEEVIRLDTSWKRRIPVHFYRVARTRTP